MKQLFLCLLWKGPHWTADETPELDALQEAHLANIDRLRREGSLLAAGPCSPEGELRGIFVLTAADMGAAYDLVVTDPAIRAGRLRPELHPWWVDSSLFPRRVSR